MTTPRRRLSFGLRTLFVVIALASVAMAVLRFVSEPPIPSPLAPALIVDSAVIMDGGSLEATIKDAGGRRFRVRILNNTESPNPVCQLWWFRPNGTARRVLRRSRDEQRVLESLQIAVREMSRRPPSGSADRDRHLLVGQAMIRRFSHLDN